MTFFVPLELDHEKRYHYEQGLWIFAVCIPIVSSNHILVGFEFHCRSLLLERVSQG